MGDMIINQTPKTRKPRKSYVRVCNKTAILMSADAVGELQNQMDEQSGIKTYEAAVMAAASDPQQRTNA